ncbi:MAG: hypothetical protein ACP5JV_09255 [Thermus sp.]|uniref:hypothetical protein n=1 Tax=Thermus sp. TaxID=275 RepID=UPI003D11BC20
MLRSLLLALGLSLALAGCSATLTLPLPDQTVKVAAVADTGGKVVYPANPNLFSPPRSILDVRVEGTLEASQDLFLTLDLYARTEDPAQDPGCFALSDLRTTYAYACSVGPEDEKIGQAGFANTKSAPLSLSGSKLTEGIKQGRLWLGVMAKGLPAAEVTFTFKNLRATVTLGF